MPRRIASEYVTAAASLLAAAGRSPEARGEALDLMAYALSRKATLARNQSKVAALESDPARAIADGVRIAPRLPRFPGREVLPEGTARDVAAWTSAAPVGADRRAVVRRARRDRAAATAARVAAPDADATAQNGEV